MLGCRNKVRKTELGHTELSGQINKLTLIMHLGSGDGHIQSDTVEDG